MTTSAEPVTLGKAALRGFLGKCPHCGEGKLFGRFLKVVHHCDVCGEEMHHQRADDFPAYLVIVVVGHVIIPIVLAVEMAYAPPYWLHFLIWIPLTFFTSIGLLQPTKGAIVGLQWQTGMDGFEGSKLNRAAIHDAELADRAA